MELQPLEELIQHQLLIKYASVITNKNSLIALSLKPLRLSGDHLNSKSKLKVNLRELVNMEKKLRKLLRKEKPQLLKQLPHKKLRMRKPLKTLVLLKNALSQQLKNHTNSDKLRLHKRKYSSKELLQREELKLLPGNSNLM